MDQRFILFMALAVGVLAVNQIAVSILFPPSLPRRMRPRRSPKRRPAKPLPNRAMPMRPTQKKTHWQSAPANAPPADKVAPADEANKPDEPPAAAVQAPPQPLVESQRIALGSGDPDSPYRMAVYLTNDGAAIERLEMNSPRYRESENRSGYLGYLSPADATGHKAGSGARGRLGHAGRRRGTQTRRRHHGGRHQENHQRHRADQRARSDRTRAVKLKSTVLQNDATRKVTRPVGLATAGRHPAGTRQQAAAPWSPATITTPCRS